MALNKKCVKIATTKKSKYPKNEQRCGARFVLDGQCCNVKTLHAMV